jgi:hypothetical protein
VALGLKPVFPYLLLAARVEAAPFQNSTNWQREAEFRVNASV